MEKIFIQKTYNYLLRRNCTEEDINSPLVLVSYTLLCNRLNSKVSTLSWADSSTRTFQDRWSSTESTA